MVGRERERELGINFPDQIEPHPYFSRLGANTRQGPEPAVPGALLPTPATSPSPCQCGPQTTCAQMGGVGAVRSGPQAILCPGLEGRAHPNASASAPSSLSSSPFSSPLRHPRCQGQKLTSSSCPAPNWSLCQAPPLRHCAHTWHFAGPEKANDSRKSNPHIFHRLRNLTDVPSCTE